MIKINQFGIFRKTINANKEQNTKRSYAEYTEEVKTGVQKADNKIPKAEN